MNAPDHFTRMDLVAPPMRYHWTTTEIAVVKTHYSVGGVDACLALLPNRTSSGVYQQAAKLGLRAPGVVTVRRKHHSTNEQIDAEIRRVYTSSPTRSSVSNLAASLDRPRWWVSKRAQQLGIVAPRFKESAWTSDELAIVESNATKRLETIQRAMKRAGYDRTCTAIKLQIKRKHIEHVDEDNLTARGLAVVMGIDSKTIARWIEHEGLTARRRGTDRTAAQGGDMWQINRRTFRLWLKDHAQCVDLRKVDKFAFFDLIFG